MKRTVMCVGTWPENGYEDFEVFDVKSEESDEDAILRAQEAYGSYNEFYIIETRDAL